MENERWRLPDGIDEILPPRARELDGVRHALLDLYFSWGYELVIPPVIEYLESPLTGTGRALDLNTFKLVDQMSAFAVCTPISRRRWPAWPLINCSVQLPVDCVT